MLDIPYVFVPYQPGASTPKIVNLFFREPLEFNFLYVYLR